ncbi:MAG: DMT family transporter, partial [Phototrophicaceae bacterium]
GLALLCGGLLALHFITWIQSLEHTSVLISVTVVSTTPIWVALMEWVFFKTRLTRWILIGLILTMLGGVLVTLESGGNSSTIPHTNLLLGIILAFIGAVSASGFLVIGRSLRQDLTLLPYIWLIYGSGGLILIMLLATLRIPVWGYSPTAWLALLGAAAIPQLVGHTAMNYAVRHVSATMVSLFTKIEPIGSAILAFFLFTETPNLWQILGSVVILAGIYLATLNEQ